MHDVKRHKDSRVPDERRRLDGLPHRVSLKERPDLFTLLSKYNSLRAICFNIIPIHGLEPEGSSFVYCVQVVISSAEHEKHSDVAAMHDYTSSTDTVVFRQDPLLFHAVPSRPESIAVLRVWAVDTRRDDVKPVAWAIIPLFIGKGVQLQGNFATPLYPGSPPSDLEKQCSKQPLADFAEAQELMGPKYVIVFTVGDEARMDHMLQGNPLFSHTVGIWGCEPPQNPSARRTSVPGVKAVTWLRHLKLGKEEADELHWTLCERLERHHQAGASPP